MKSVDFFQFIRESQFVFFFFGEFCSISGKFQQYHHGTDENIRIYGQPTPPEYDLSKVQTKIHILYGTNDLISPEQVNSSVLFTFISVFLWKI